MNATTPQEPGPNWYDVTAIAATERPRLNFDLDVEVCVIGGGLAGLTVARETARRGWSVAVLEARRVGWNASGRNCGFVLPGFAAPVDRIVERVGLDQARELWKLSERGVAYIRETIAETDMAGVTPVDGWLNVSQVDDGDDILPMLALLGQEFGADVEGWPVERVRDVLKTDHYFHAVHVPGAFHLHALNYARGLASAAEQVGARIFEETEALQIDPAGVRKRVMTSSARVRAAHVVLAGNVHIGGLVPHLAETVLPVSSFVAVTAPLGDRLAEAVTWRGAVSDSRGGDRYYRIVDGDRLMWSGATNVRPGDPHKVAKRFRAEIRRLYPQLGDVEIAHIWEGLSGVAVHRMPQIGEVSPGVWLASAFAGHGLNTSAMAGDLIARAIVEGDDRWRLFLPYELVWTGGAVGRAITQASYWSRQLRERVVAAAARRREAIRRAKEAQEAGYLDGGVTPPSAAGPTEAGLAPADNPDRSASPRIDGAADEGPPMRRPAPRERPANLPAAAEETGGDH